MPDFWELASDMHRDELSWLESLLDDLLRGRNARSLARLAREVLGHEAFAVGLSYGLFTAQSHASAEMGELVRAFALAEVYDVMFGGLDLSRSLPFGVNIPLRALADAIGHDSMLHFQLETAHHHREALMRQLHAVLRHKGAFLHGLPEAVRRDCQAKWHRVVELYERAEVADRFEAGKRAGELFWELLNLLAALVVLGLLARELAALGPDLVRLARGLATCAESLPTEARPPPPSAIPEPMQAAAVTEPPPVEPVAPAAPYEAPPLTHTGGREMFREAVGNLKKAPPEQRAELFDKYRAQITERSRGQWNAQRLDATNGTAFSGEGGEALAFDKAGNMYRGPAGIQSFPYKPGEGISINFDNFKPL